MAVLRQRWHGAYVDIAHGHIQDRRARKQVPCDPGGNLCDYVPFYFAPRSPMLYTIHCGNVSGYCDGQPPIIHLVTDAEHVPAAGMRCVFTDGHAVMDISRFYTDLRYLTRVDWDVMKSRYWHDTPEAPDRKRRRQAEFLVHRRVPWSMIHEIGVLNAEAERQVHFALDGAAHRPVVAVRREWYY